MYIRAVVNGTGLDTTQFDRLSSLEREFPKVALEYKEEYEIEQLEQYMIDKDNDIELTAYQHKKMMQLKKDYPWQARAFEWKHQLKHDSGAHPYLIIPK